MAIELQAVLRMQDRISGTLNRVLGRMDNFRRTTSRVDDSLSRTQTQTERLNRVNNQLQTSTERTSRAMSNFTRQNYSANSSMSSFSSGAKSALTAVGALTAGVLGTVGAYKTLNATVGEAMKMEQSQIVIEAMIDDSKLSKQYMDMMDKFAISSPVLNTQDMYANSKSFLAASKDTKELEKMWNLAERLVAVDPVQGVEGAVN